MRRGVNIVHFNVADFPVAVAAAKDRSLAGKAFVIADPHASRSVVLSPSRFARESGIGAGMPLASALRRERGLLVIPPDPVSCARADEAMASMASAYSPIVQSDRGGHLYLDLTGTGRLFGSSIDCAVRIRNDIVERLGLDPTVAVAGNKLVAKVATRSIRPSGIAYIRDGEESGFLAPQDALLLPGVGPAVARVLSVTGIREIGALASLADHEVLSFFGKRGFLLRTAARGVDESPVVPGKLEERTISRGIRFHEESHEAHVLHAAVITLAEDAGVELRRSQLAALRVSVAAEYADGRRGEAFERFRRPVVLDSDLIAAADRLLARSADRRVRLRGLTLSLSRLVPARREPDLFIPDGFTRPERLQTAVDASRIRFGLSSVTRASALAVSHA